MSEYIMNKETGKIELHFDKADYLALSEEQKKDIKSNYLFSRAKSAWISRAKFPNLYRAEKVAKDLGLSNGGNVGEKLTFAEQMERKAERAEARAERFDYKSNRAEENGKTLQKPINDMHGDISFFTQPNINSSSGRAFTKRRNRMWEAWEKGFDEFKKSEYYAERIASAFSRNDEKDISALADFIHEATYPKKLNEQVAHSFRVAYNFAHYAAKCHLENLNNEFLQKQLENAGLEAYSPILVSFYDLLADLMDCYENWDFPSDSKKLAAMFNRLIRFERKINSV